jgi:hypothetical protein
MIFPRLVMDMLQDPGCLCRGTISILGYDSFVYIQNFF